MHFLITGILGLNLGLNEVNPFQVQKNSSTTERVTWEQVGSTPQSSAAGASAASWSS